MNFFTHTSRWIKGEMFDAGLMAGVGILLIGTAVISWRLAATPAVKTIVLPLLAVGGLLALSGVSGYLSNQGRLLTFEQAFQEEPVAFAQAEKSRVEGFQYLYTVTIAFALFCFATAVAIFWWTLNLHWRAAGIALAFLGLSGLVIDYFSKDRADVYYQAIQQELAGVSRE